MKLKDRYIKRIVCPCCKEKKLAEDLTLSLGRKVHMWGSREINIDFEFLSKTQAVDWTCDKCLNEKKAIQAIFDNQKYIDKLPRLAYFDKEIVCRSCGVEYNFSKEEQKFWYEDLQFWTQSDCTNCKKCRMKIREERNLNTELSELLKNKTDLDKQKLVRISDIYKLMGKDEKSKEYLTKSRRK
ncbi:zinc-ribbon domain containing protein [Aureibacter tunicatorum]|uniref:Uncharacterized protein YbaR (Trm112 family) n=1 Tax=Aureibacter tunicatorum TaxID=866807 RepID=A0AAE3XKY8_9BACT|nr:zinc-ribbon domain containing protein [Aureibacter tunicatorum]MDR6238787.1 uncharacterized protein YbaR (Trm112 family) [Aureibacter tunicatorum]BDD05283.1 hypothetical protein AUTU_27660 [Aureibacter tunicatorum]